MERRSLHLYSQTNQTQTIRFSCHPNSLPKLLLLGQNNLLNTHASKNILNRKSAYNKRKKQKNIQLKDYVYTRPSLIQLKEQQLKRKQQLKKKIKIHINQRLQKNVNRQNNKYSVVQQIEYKSIDCDDNFQIINSTKSIINLRQKQKQNKPSIRQSNTQVKRLLNFKQIYKNRNKKIIQRLHQMNTTQFNICDYVFSKGKQQWKKKQKTNDNKRQLTSVCKGIYLNLKKRNRIQKNNSSFYSQSQEIKPWISQFQQNNDYS